MNGESYLVGGTTVSDMLGYETELYFDEDKQIVHAATTGNDELTRVSSMNRAEFKTDKIEYIENGKIKTIKVDVNSSVIYNKVYTGTVRSVDFKALVASAYSVDIIKTKNNEQYFFVNVYNTYAFESYDESNDTIYAKYDKAYEIPNNADEVIITNLYNGKRTDISSVKEWNILDVMEVNANSGTVVYITVSDYYVKGRLTAISDTNGITQYSIDGTFYDVSSALLNCGEDLPKMGDRAVYYCDSLGRLAAVDYSAVNYYAYLYSGYPICMYMVSCHQYGILSLKKIAALDKTNKKVTVATPRDKYSTEQSEFIFKNIAEEINAPGECYFDNTDRKVYYYPYTNQVNDIVLAVSKEALINGKGTKNIQFKNIAFEYSRTNLFSVSESDNVTFENCDFKHFAEINTLNGNGNKMIGCNFYNGSRGGLLFSGGDAKTLTGGGNVIDNCVFDDLANVRPSYAAAISMSGYNNTVKNSEIKNSEHLLMQVGGADQIIDGNKIHHGVQWTTDMGSVYYGRTATTIGVEFKNNEFYDNRSISGDYGSHSIYWDDRAIGPWIHDNIFYNTDKEEGMKVNSTALKSNAGVYATVENNIFINIEPIRNQDYNFGKNQHIVFWLLCNNKPTLIKDDTSFQGWWDKIKESGYFGAWQEYYKNSVWKDYLTILTEECYNEVKDITNQSELIAIAEKYAPAYGINKFVNNIVYGADENSVECYTLSTVDKRTKF